MTTVTPVARFPCIASFDFPVVTASTLELGAQTGLQTYMPYPDAMGDVTWQGAQFGLSAPAGANITDVQITVTHRISNALAFDQVTAQVWAGDVPVGAPPRSPRRRVTPTRRSGSGPGCPPRRWRPWPSR